MSNTDIGEGHEARKAGTLKDVAMDAAEGVKREAASFAANAQDQLSDTVEDRRDEAVQRLHVFADAIRTAGEDLSKHDQSVVGQLVRQAADGLEGLSRSVSDKSPEDLLAAVRQFGRDNPVAFAGAAVLLGVALGRVARSSAPEAASTGSTAATNGASGGATPAAPQQWAGVGIGGETPLSTAAPTASTVGTEASGIDRAAPGSGGATDATRTGGA